MLKLFKQIDSLRRFRSNIIDIIVPFKVIPYSDANILTDFTISNALPLASRGTVTKLLSLRKSILSSLHLSEFSLNLLSLDHRRTSCTVSSSTYAPNLGTISETVVSSANFHMEDEVLLVVRSLIITKKSHGPIRVPCGIPVGTGLKSEKQSKLSLAR